MLLFYVVKSFNPNSRTGDQLYSDTSAYYSKCFLNLTQINVVQRCSIGTMINLFKALSFLFSSCLSAGLELPTLRFLWLANVQITPIIIRTAQKLKFCIRGEFVRAEVAAASKTIYKPNEFSLEKVSHQKHMFCVFLFSSLSFYSSTVIIIFFFCLAAI